MQTIDVEIGGKMRKMRASFSNMIALEAATGCSWTALTRKFSLDAESMMPANVSISDIVEVLYNGLQGAAEDIMKKEDIQKEVVELGIINLYPACLHYLMAGLKGSSSAKKSASQAE